MGLFCLASVLCHCCCCFVICNRRKSCSLGTLLFLALNSSHLLKIIACIVVYLNAYNFLSQLFFDEVKQYEPKVEAMLKDSQDLVESTKLDKTDIDGVDKTKTALNTRWKAVNDHLKDRQQK